MNQLLILGVALLLGALYFFIGIRAAKSVKSDTDYYVAGRSLGLLPVAVNLIATQIGGGMILGTAQEAFTQGWYGIMYTLSMSLGFLLLGLGIAARLQQFNVTTVAQLFETQFASPTLKKIASILSIITLFGILVAQVIGFKSLITTVGASGFWVDLLWMSVVIYTMLGGLRAITINDMVQLAFRVTILGGIFLYSISQNPTAILNLMSPETQQALFMASAPSLSSLFPIIIMPALFSLFEQDLAQRFFASKSAAIATKASFISALFLLGFSFIPVYFGMQARAMGLELNGQNPLMVVLNLTTSPFVFALVVSSVIAAIISTSDALINSISANVTQDFNLSWTSKPKLTLSRIVSLLIGIAALGASYLVEPRIINTIADSYAISVSCLLVPLIFCFIHPEKTLNKYAAFGSILGGIAGLIGFRFYDIGIPKELATLGLSFIGYQGVQLIRTHKMKQ